MTQVSRLMEAFETPSSWTLGARTRSGATVLHPTGLQLHVQIGPTTTISFEASNEPFYQNVGYWIPQSPLSLIQWLSRTACTQGLARMQRLLQSLDDMTPLIGPVRGGIITNNRPYQWGTHVAGVPVSFALQRRIHTCLSHHFGLDPWLFFVPHRIDGDTIDLPKVPTLWFDHRSAHQRLRARAVEFSKL